MENSIAKKNFIVLTSFLLLVFFLLVSCESLDSVKRGLTGEKKSSSDEFFVKKKDPLILPPDYENLPTPGDELAEEEITSFEKSLEDAIEEDSLTSSSVEESILRKIRSR